MYKKNLEAVKNNKLVFSYYEKNNADYNKELVVVEEAKNGEKIVTYNNGGKKLYFNSKYNPANEASKKMEDFANMQDESYVFFYGLANGSYVREFLSINKKEVRCVVYEPSLDIFNAVISNIDISDILESDRVKLVVKGINDSELGYVISSSVQIYNKDVNKNMAPNYYTEIFKEDYEKYSRLMIDCYEKFYVMTNTAIENGKFAVEDNIYNMKYLKGCRSVVNLAGKFPEDMIGVVVAAGPSLEKNVELLNKMKNKAFVIVVDSATERVLKTGFKPDMFTAIDYSKPVELFHAPGLNKIPMCVGMDFNVKVLDFLKPENLYFATSDSIVWDDLFRDAGSEIRSMTDGGSVATFSLALLVAWGFKRIVMMGQDLALTGNRVHVGEDVQDFDLEHDKDRYTYVKDIYGNDALCRKDFYIYLKWIEDLARIYDDIDFIDATEGGALKANTRVMTLQEVIDKYCQKEYDIASILESEPRLFVGDQEHLVIDALDRMKRELVNLKKKMTNCMADCRQGKLLLERKQFDVKQLKKINANIKKTDEAIEESCMRSYMNKYLTSAEIIMLKDMFEVEEDDIQESIRMYEKSCLYYENLSEGIPGLIEMIEDCRKQIVEGN